MKNKYNCEWVYTVVEIRVAALNARSSEIRSDTTQSLSVARLLGQFYSFSWNFTHDSFVLYSFEVKTHQLNVSE